jgi:hypothetical protein
MYMRSQAVALRHDPDTLPPTDMIDTKSQEIKAADDETYSDMRELADELPDSSPRFILLSYPYTLVR